MRRLQKMFFNVQGRIENAIYSKQWDIVNSLTKVSTEMSKCLNSGKVSNSQLEVFEKAI